MASTTSSGGVAKSAAREPIIAGGAYVGSARDALGGYAREDILPVNRMIVDGTAFDAATAAVSAGITASKVSAPAGEFCSKSLRLTIPAAATSAIVMLPLPADGWGNLSEVGSFVQLRLAVSEWASFQTMSFILYESDANRYEIAAVDLGFSQVGCKDPLYAPVWDAKYRTIGMFAQQRKTTGTPSRWAAGIGDAESIKITKIGIRLAKGASTNPVTIDINRMYSPRWPVGMLMLIGDGATKSFCQTVVEDCGKIGFHGTVSLNRREAEGGEIFPNPPMLQRCHQLR